MLEPSHMELFFSRQIPYLIGKASMTIEDFVIASQFRPLLCSSIYMWVWEVFANCYNNYIEADHHITKQLQLLCSLVLNKEKCCDENLYWMLCQKFSLLGCIQIKLVFKMKSSVLAFLKNIHAMGMSKPIYFAPWWCAVSTRCKVGEAYADPKWAWTLLPRSKDQSQVQGLLFQNVY